MPKRMGRKDREKRILLGLVEYYIKTGKPVGSEVLHEAGFQDMSSATIRNYFAVLEEEGYVSQLHSSGGRIPTSRAFHLYAQECIDDAMKEELEEGAFSFASKNDFQDIISCLQETAATLSARLRLGVIISSPRFDRDSIVDIHFHFLDVRRALAVVISELGVIHTQVLMPLEPLSPSLIRKADRFAKARIYKEPLEKEIFEGEELQLIRRLYQEAVASFFVSYSSFSSEDIWKVGFSHLLEYPEFEESESLTASLSLFENTSLLRGLFREVERHNALRFWMGETLKPYVSSEPNCAFIAVPYHISNHPVGAIGVLGPERMMYKDVFRYLHSWSNTLSSYLTNLFIKHRISYRMPESSALEGAQVRKLAVEFYSPKLLESK